MLVLLFIQHVVVCVGKKKFSWCIVIHFVWSSFLFCMCVVITVTLKYGKNTKIFGILGVTAKTLYGYWSIHPCLVGVLG